MNKYIICILLGSLLIAGICFADTKVANDPSRISVGARVLGMGKSFLGLSDDISSMFINPAGLAEVHNPQFTSMSGKFINEVNYLNLGGAVPGFIGTFGFGYISSDIGFTGPAATIEVLDGVRIIPSSTEGVSYSYKNSAMLFSLGGPLESMPFEFLNKMSVGATLKIFAQTLSGPQITGGNASGYDMDLGIKYKLHPAVGLGAVVQNVIPFSMGGKIVWGTGAEESLPSVLKLGMSAKMLGEKGLLKLGSNELTINLDGDFTPLRTNIPSLLHFGVEWSPIELLSLRGGIDQDIVGKGGGALDAANNLSLGVGILFRGFRFDYAFHQYYSLSENDTNYFSLSYGLFKEKPEQKVIKYINILSPDDRAVAFSDNVKIKGEVLRPEVKQVTVKGLPIAFEGMTFEAEAALLPQKNSIEITALDGTGKVLEVKKIRLLKLLSFSDVGDAYWAKDPISKLATLGIIAGYADGGFKPDKSINRAEMLTLLVRVAGVTTEGVSIKLGYKDVSSKFWAAKFIAVGSKLKFMTGYPDKTFKPVKSISRAEGAVTVARFSGVDISKAVYESPFLDLPGRHWAIKEISAMVNMGALKYLEGKKFEQGKALTRGEVAEILSKSDPVNQKVADLMDWEKGY